MRFSDSLKLISVANSTNEIGDSTEIESFDEVFANKKSIRQSEFYQAAATGLKPELMFEIRAESYNNNRAIEYNGKRYTVIRTFEKNTELIEIICSAIVGTEVRHNA